MNNARRKIKREAIALLSSAMELLTDVVTGEEEAYFNMPESLQCTERGEQMESNIDLLNEYIKAIEEYIEELEYM